MGLDRRILSILYYNDIVDVNDVEEFIGEENGYYIVKVCGENRKLKVPGVDYPEDEEIFAEFDLENEPIEPIEEPIEPIENETLVQKTIEESLLEVEKESKESLLSVTTEVVITEPVEQAIEKIKEVTDLIDGIEELKPETEEEEKVIEGINDEVKKLSNFSKKLKEKTTKITTKKPKKKTTKKKTTKTTTKKIDDDFDDFIKIV